MSRLKPFFSMESKCKRLEKKRKIVINKVLALIKHDYTNLICFTVERSGGYFKTEIQFLNHECDIRGN